MYITFDDYVGLYWTDRITPEAFTRIAIEAQRIMDMYTTGIDSVKKLQVAFPTDECDAKTVKACACKIADLLFQMQTAEDNAMASRKYTQTANGLQGGVITSMSSGNESVSYGSSNSNTAVDKAASDPVEREKLLRDTVKQYLSGITDANGVNLLYMGRYPVRIDHV